MYLIVGLGNPEKEYWNTRHNMGFNVINKIAENYKIEVTYKKYEGLFWLGEIEGEKVILLKPLTYMNLSGDCVAAVTKKLNIPLDKICVIYDDIDLDIGAIRYRINGSAGTHNGMRDIVSKLNSTEFPRVRIGIGKPADRPLVDYVLSKVPKENERIYTESFDKVYRLILDFVKNDGKLEAKSL